MAPVGCRLCIRTSTDYKASASQSRNTAHMGVTQALFTFAMKGNK